MPITWKQHYHLSSVYCDTSGWAPLTQEEFKSYLVLVVRPEWRRWLTIDPALAQSLYQTGFSSDAIEEIIKADSPSSTGTILLGDFGEVFSTLFLTEQCGMKFPWPTFWDRRNPKASLSGGDLVGFAYDNDGAILVVGQAKASGENRQPPTVVTHPKHGLVAQLMLMCETRSLILSHIRWLLVRSLGTDWEQDLLRAIGRFFEESARIVAGVLVRDCPPSVSDLGTAHAQLMMTGGAKVQLFGCYLPLSLDECIKTSTDFSN